MAKPRRNKRAGKKMKRKTVGREKRLVTVYLSIHIKW
jgi:hypothetical protein